MPDVRKVSESGEHTMSSNLTVQLEHISANDRHDIDQQVLRILWYLLAIYMSLATTGPILLILVHLVLLPNQHSLVKSLAKLLNIRFFINMSRMVTSRRIELRLLG